ncbi:MAG: hypothetical protein M3N95_05030 [Actinomycetota bacterium]|nr:hypothetical protein [Actinomycetota bacterium]
MPLCPKVEAHTEQNADNIQILLAKITELTEQVKRQTAARGWDAGGHPVI